MSLEILAPVIITALLVIVLLSLLPVLFREPVGAAAHAPHDVLEPAARVASATAIAPPGRAPRARPAEAPYRAWARWSRERPRILVVACSDGRLQRPIDEFLRIRLGIQHPDRLYVAGGPGALAGVEARAAQLREDVAFLLTAHAITDVVLLFHGAASPGPPDAVCADYRRRHGAGTDMRPIQERDAAAVASAAPFDTIPRVRSFRAEVVDDGEVRFVQLGTDRIAPKSSKYGASPPRLLLR